MGLDFTHTDAHFSYGDFGEFRRALARWEGFDLDAMAGHCAPWRGDDPLTHQNRPWDEIDVPLKPLLNHSDCDGDLSPEECAQVAPRLREAIDALWPDSDGSLEARLYRGNGLALADGMDRAAAAGERLGFC